jgi:polyisoprenoid-binding protein YceI
MLRELSAARYAVDPRLSRFTVRVTSGGPLAKLGHNPAISISDFSGEIECVREKLDESYFSVGIHAKSLVVVEDMSESDRAEIQATMLRDVLEIEKFPEIAFTSSSIVAEQVLEGLFRIGVTGNLTLHGVVRRLQFTSQVAFVGDSLRASGDFTILQTDYNIKLYSVAVGALKLKDELRFTFDIVAKRAV